MSLENTKIGKFLNHIYENYLIYLNGLNTVIFAIIGILFELNTTVTIYNVNTKTIGWILFVAVVILTIVQIIYQIKDTKSIEKIEKEKEQIIFSLGNEKKELEVKIQNLENQISKINNNSIEIVETHLAYLFEKMNLKNSERISLYKFIDDKFYVLGRFSNNPELRKRGRNSYKKEGLIFKAWQLGNYFKNSGIPNPNMSTRPKFRKGYYKVLNDIASIDEETVWKMNMKSRSFYLKALKDSGNLENTSIIVIESLNENGFQLDSIENILSSEEKRKLVTFVEKIDWDFPNINKATEKGF
jgi:hypothetical protein